jgi:hypothetical protein
MAIRFCHFSFSPFYEFLIILVVFEAHAVAYKPTYETNGGSDSGSGKQIFNHKKKEMVPFL